MSTVYESLVELVKSDPREPVRACPFCGETKQTKAHPNAKHYKYVKRATSDARVERDGCNAVMCFGCGSIYIVEKSGRRREMYPDEKARLRVIADVSQAKANQESIMERMIG